MSSYVAFLRGINVGGRVIKMADLRVCFEDSGFGDVRTVLQTGNVLLQSDETDIARLKQKIESMLSAAFNYPAKVQILPEDDLRLIIEKYPFKAAGSKQHDYVIFLENGLEKNLIKEDYQLAPEEKVQAGPGVIYWQVDKGRTLKSNFAKLLAKAKYKSLNTNRNLKTLQKLV